MDPEMVKLILPLAVLQIGLQIYALINLFVQNHGRTRNLNGPIWGVIIVLGSLLGAVLYLLLGRSETEG